MLHVEVHILVLVWYMYAHFSSFKSPYSRSTHIFCEKMVPTQSSLLSNGILLGRGPICYNNDGNQMFRMIVREHKQRAGNEPISDNLIPGLVRDIYLTCQDRGYRFLVHEGRGKWIEASKNTTMKMIRHQVRARNFLKQCTPSTPHSVHP